MSVCSAKAAVNIPLCKGNQFQLLKEGSAAQAALEAQSL